MKGGMKLGLVGLAGSGKTTYLVLLNGMFADMSKILVKEPTDVREIERLILDFEISDVEFVGKFSVREILKYIQDYWMKGMPLDKTPSTGDLRRYRMWVKVPIFRKKNSYKKVLLDIPDPSGETLKLLSDIFRKIEKTDPREIFDPNRIRKYVLYELEGLGRSDPDAKWAKQVYDLIKPTDYDGFLIFIDPDRAKTFEAQSYLYPLLYILLGAQRKTITVSVIFSKSLAREVADTVILDDLKTKKYEEYVYDRAFEYFKRHYGLIYGLFKKLVCEEGKARFAGTFFYDAFIGADGDIPKPKFDRFGVPYLESFSPLLPLIHTIHVHYKLESPLPYKGLKDKLCR